MNALTKDEAEMVAPQIAMRAVLMDLMLESAARQPAGVIATLQKRRKNATKDVRYAPDSLDPASQTILNDALTFELDQLYLQAIRLAELQKL